MRDYRIHYGSLWCHALLTLRQYLLDALHTSPSMKIPNILNSTFHAVDGQLSQMAAENKTHSGCTAVTAFIRIEDSNGGQSFLTETPITLTEEPSENGDSDSSPRRSISNSSPRSSTTGSTLAVTETPSGRTTPSSSGSKIRNAVRSFTSKLSSGSKSDHQPQLVRGSKAAPFEPNWQADGNPLRRVLYAANAGDARAVLNRGGDALRLTYDHKGSDAQESKRITDAGGFVMNNRVNGTWSRRLARK